MSFIIKQNKFSASDPVLNTTTTTGTWGEANTKPI